MNEVITKGSPTSTGGKVITGSSSVKVNGASGSGGGRRDQCCSVYPK